MRLLLVEDEPDLADALARSLTDSDFAVDLSRDGEDGLFRALEIPYVLHNVAKNSPSRDAFVALSGKMQVPYLVDPNGGVAMFESADIVDYLDATYGAPAAA